MYILILRHFYHFGFLTGLFVFMFAHHYHVQQAILHWW